MGKILGNPQIPTAIVLYASIVCSKPHDPKEEKPHCDQKINLYPEAQTMVLQQRFDS
jgi:hypothetical protein